MHMGPDLPFWAQIACDRGCSSTVMVMYFRLTSTNFSKKAFENLQLFVTQFVLLVDPRSAGPAGGLG